MTFLQALQRVEFVKLCCEALCTHSQHACGMLNAFVMALTGSQPRVVLVLTLFLLQLHVWSLCLHYILGNTVPSSIQYRICTALEQK